MATREKTLGILLIDVHVEETHSTFVIAAAILVT